MISGALNPNLLSEGILSGCYDIIKWARNVPSYDNQSGVRMVSLQSCEQLWLFWYDWDDGNWFVTAGCHPTHFSYHIWITKQSVREEEIKYKNKRCHSLGDTTEILVACLPWRISVLFYLLFYIPRTSSFFPLLFMLEKSSFVLMNECKICKNVNVALGLLSPLALAGQFSPDHKLSPGFKAGDQSLVRREQGTFSCSYLIILNIGGKTNKCFSSSLNMELGTYQWLRALKVFEVHITKLFITILIGLI